MGHSTVGSPLTPQCYNGHMRVLTIALAVVLAGTLVQPVAGQPGPPARVVALPDFADDSTQGALIDAGRLNTLLGRLLAERSGGRLRVVLGDGIRAAMQSHNFSALDLDYPSRAAEIAKAVGADWLITGRWTYIEADRGLLFPIDRMEFPIGSDGEATITIRVVDAATRRILLDESFWSAAHGAGRWTVLRWATDEALRKASERIVQL